MGVTKQVANNDITELPGHVEVDLPILSKVIIITRRYVTNDQNLQNKYGINSTDE